MIIEENGYDISSHSEEDMKRALEKSDTVMNRILIENNVEPTWGGLVGDWLPFDRMFLEELGFETISDDTILRFETDFKIATRDSDWEYFTDDAIKCLNSLNSMGYPLGICTRRHDDPRGLIVRNNLSELFKTIQWSGVPGYAKPSPYTLLEAAKDLRVNPRTCLFVGNYVKADVEAAIRCEMTPVLLTWANPDEANIAPDGCIVLENPTDLIGWIQSRDASSIRSSEI